MFGHTFYNATIKKHVIVMGTLFNQIYISREDDAGNEVSVIRVPITYGPKDKVLTRRTTDPDLSRPFSSILPFMTFELMKVRYDSARQLPKTGRFVGVASDPDWATRVYNPVPYDFEFQLNVIVKNVEDGLKIIEQIAPFFNPDWTVTVKLLDAPPAVLDIKVLMDPIVPSDNWDAGDYSAPRYVTWTLNFLMQGYLFGPTGKGKIIKSVSTNIGEQLGDPLNTVEVTPGLTSDGKPTSDPSQTVPWSQISWDDDYGYINDVTIGDG